MQNVFIDTNVLLSFYAFTSDDLAELEKLVEEINAKRFRLLITDQVRDEFRRNREAKIADALKGFVEKAGIDAFPRMIQHFEEYKELSEAAEKYKERKSVIRRKLEKEIRTRSLPADRIFNEILEATQIIETTEEIAERAHYRVSLGRPPGKNGSLGDAVNWELLLSACQPKSNLKIVTNDKDYLSPVTQDRFNEYLADEWREKCGGEVELYSKLREMLKEVVPKIQLSPASNALMESIRLSVRTDNGNQGHLEWFVRAIENSPSFTATHHLLAGAPDAREFSPEQVDRLFRAAVENSEIAWISSDEDVQSFFRSLYQAFPNLLGGGIKSKYLGFFG